MNDSYMDSKELSNNEFLYDLLSVNLFYGDMYTHFICLCNLLCKIPWGQRDCKGKKLEKAPSRPRQWVVSGFCNGPERTILAFWII